MLSYLEKITDTKKLNRIKNTLELMRGETVNIELVKSVFPSEFNEIDEESLDKLLKYYSITLEETGNLVLQKSVKSKREIIAKGTFKEIVDYIESNYEALFGEFHQKVLRKLSDSKSLSQMYPGDMYAPQNNKLLPQLGNMASVEDVMSELNKLKLFNVEFTIREIS